MARCAPWLASVMAMAASTACERAFASGEVREVDDAGGKVAGGVSRGGGGLACLR